MSSLYAHPGEEKPNALDWARLIPGDTREGRRQAQAAHAVSSQKVAVFGAKTAAGGSDSAWRLLTPSPLHGRLARRWIRSMTADFALVALDWLLIGALLVPLRILFPHVRTFEFAAGAPVPLLGLAVLHASLITLLGYTEGLHAGGRDRRRQGVIVGKSVLWATAVLSLAYVLQGAPWSTGALFCAAGLLHFGVLWMWRWQTGREESRGELRNVLIIGAGGVARRVASHMEGHPEMGRALCGFLDNDRPLGNGVIGRISDLARMARTGFVDEVILAAPHDRGLTVEVVREAQRLRLDVEIIPELFGCKAEGAEVERLGDLPVICLHAERLPAAGLVLKRVLDAAGAGLALAILSPLLAVIAGWIKLDSPGSVLYCAQRVGRKGRLFRCYKFRTMVNGADSLKEQLRRSNQRSGPFFKIAQDPRITRLGRFLRRYSLDELPQLWNVVKGDMSLVGPRPHPLDDVAGYEIEHLARFDVTPGITGLWQVTARRDPSFERGMELDREYIRTWSLAADLRILLKTALAVVRGSGD